jgi:hypothetical protein
MKQHIYLLLFLTFSLSTKAAGDFETEKWSAPFSIYETTTNTKLSPKQCQVQLYFFYPNPTNAERRVYMSINGVLEEFTLKNLDPVTYDLTPGKYVFKIWGGPGYEEIITDSIVFDSQTLNKASVQIRSASEPVMVFKPVIYFHSDEELAVSVGVDPVGEFTFTYPEIGSGWKGTVKKDGSFVSNGQSFPYLFWESNQEYSFQASDNGFKLKKSEVISFLEKKCGEFGFNSRETADFITFWGPKICATESVFIQFSVDEACSQFADMQITPTPDNVKRVYIQFTEWSDAMTPFLKEKVFESISSEGFTVLEWGGFHFSLPEMAF